jgi:hypothetical protein
MKRVALLLVVAACSRSSDKPAAKPDRAATELLLAHVPPTTEAIAGGSLKELASWPLWRQIVAVAAYEAPGVADSIVAKCSLDPWTVIDSVALAFTSDLDGTLLAAETTVDRAKLHGCVTQVAGDQVLTVEDAGKLTKYVQPEGNEFAAWTSDRLFLTMPEQMDRPAAIEALLAPQPVPQSLQPLLARVDRSGTVWGIAQATGQGFVAELISTMPLETKPLGVYAALKRDKRLHVELALVFPDAASATKGADLFSNMMANPPPPIVAWKDAIKIAAKGDETRVTFDVDEKRAKQFDDAVAAMLPAPPPPPTKREGSAAPPP